MMWLDKYSLWITDTLHSKAPQFQLALLMVTESYKHFTYLS